MNRSEQIVTLEDTISSGDFYNFFKTATGNEFKNKPISMNDIRRCLMLSHNMRVMDMNIYQVISGKELKINNSF